MEAVDVRGKFVWHELLTRDAPGAKSFYTKLTGWKHQPWPLDPTYTVCHSEQGPTAGVLPISAEFPADMPAHWLSYVGTRDVDVTVAAAVRAGGSLMKGPEDLKGAGRWAVLKDPQGAEFAILDPENAPRAEDSVPPIGTFSWHELATSDNEAAFAFYSELFGWDAIQRMDMGPIGTYLIFGQNGVQRGGIYNKPADWQAPPNWLPYAHVPNADAGFRTAVGAGAKVVTAPMDVPGGGRIATFTDPTGALFAIHSMAASQAAPPAQKVAKPKAEATAKPKAKAKAIVKPKAKAKVKAKVKVKVRTKTKAVAKRKSLKKPAAKKQVAKKSAARTAAKKTKSVRRKK